MDKSRQQFEGWFIRKYNIPEHVMNLSPIKVEIAWEAWQASRKSLEVELPYINTDPDYADPYTNGKDDGLLEMAAILNELGVTVK